MVDTAFDDFLDSDVDDFFLQASCHLLEYDVTPNSKSIQTKEINLSQEQVAKVVTSSHLKQQAVSVVENQNDHSNICEVSSEKLKHIIRNENIAIASSNNNLNFKIPSNECEGVNDDVTEATTSAHCNSQKISDTNNTPSSVCKSSNRDIITATSSLECNNSSLNIITTTIVTPSSTSYINSRFTPGFTPKAKKRKFPGPAGLLEFFDKSEEITDSSRKVLAMDIEFENFVSSQYAPEYLSFSSWQKLQTAVSSCSNLHSTAKYYSIQRVLQESSKKKLPKHMVVPVLCVLLKKFCSEESATLSVFMDDTGEINGKIDAEVLSTFKEMLVEGTALILKKVTFLCNVMILKPQNLVSIYHPDGSEKHPQNLGSILEISEPLKPMNCECSKLSHTKNNVHKTSHYNTVISHASSCITHSQNRPKNASNQNKSIYKDLQNIDILVSYKSSYPNQVKSKVNSISNQNMNINNNVSSSYQNSSISEATSQSKSMRSDAFPKNLLDEDNCMDDFDELLGNLDEKSFLEDI